MRSRLINARKEAGLTQQQLADKLGVRRDTVSFWELGKSTPDPIHVPRIRGILECQDPHLFDIDVEPLGIKVITIKDIIEMLRRQFIEKLAAIGLAPLFAHTSLALVSTPTVEPAEYLAQCRLAIDSAWDNLNTGNYPMVEKTLTAHVPTLARFARTISPFQASAASLAVEMKILQMLHATSKLQLSSRVDYAIEAVQFGALSSDKNLLSLALDWQGSTYVHCYNQPQRAIPLLNDALSNVDGDTLVKTAIYSDLSIAHAQNHDETKSLDFAEMARSTMPSYPELSPSYRSVGIGPSELNLFEGRTLLYLAEHLKNNSYAQRAYALFSKSTSQQTTGKSYRAQAYTRRADASRVLGDRDECINNLTTGYSIAVEMGSMNRLTQISDVLARVPSAWQTEKSVKELQREVSESLIVARR